MPNYRRSLVPGGTYFFTLATHRRQAILTGAASALLGSCLRQCRRQYPFSIDAIVLLPDHLHAVWTLPKGDCDYSKRWAIIKKTFSQEWLASGGQEQPMSEGIRRDRRRGVWQPRFWEHTIRDIDDYRRHMDYIHYNPVKHGYARCPHDWQWSSFRRLTNENVYRPDWGCSCEGNQAVLDFSDIEGHLGE